MALALTALITLSGCAIRYQRADVPVTEAPDLRGCMYESWKADHWGDNDYLDQCMERHGYYVDQSKSTAVWWPGMKDTFAGLDAKKKAPAEAGAH